MFLLSKDVDIILFPGPFAGHLLVPVKTGGYSQWVVWTHAKKVASLAKLLGVNDYELQKFDSSNLERLEKALLLGHLITGHDYMVHERPDGTLTSASGIK